MAPDDSQEARWLQIIRSEGEGIAEQLGLKLVPGDSIVIDPADIPEGLADRLNVLAELVKWRSGKNAIDLGAAARLLGGDQ